MSAAEPWPAISWNPRESASGTMIELRAEILHLSLLDRVLWRLGARRWMRALFARALASLDEALAPGAVEFRARQIPLALVHGEAA